VSFFLVSTLLVASGCHESVSVFERPDAADDTSVDRPETPPDEPIVACAGSLEWCEQDSDCCDERCVRPSCDPGGRPRGLCLPLGGTICNVGTTDQCRVPVGRACLSQSPLTKETAGTEGLCVDEDQLAMLCRANMGNLGCFTSLPCPRETGIYWTLEAVPARLIYGLGSGDMCGPFASQSTILGVEIPLADSCQEPGPVRAWIQPVGAVGTHVGVSAYRWIHRGDVTCVIRDRVAIQVLEMPDRSWPVAILQPDIWTVSAGINTIEFSPAPTVQISVCDPPPPYGPGVRCSATCECDSGLRCFDHIGDFVCDSECAQACSRPATEVERAELECQPGWTCQPNENLGLNYGASCMPGSFNTCPAGGCPTGMRCEASVIPEIPWSCVWDTELSAASRHACVQDSDCTAGLDCVQASDGSRNCEIRCRTANMRCPAMHACTPGTDPGGDVRWVCD